MASETPDPNLTALQRLLALSARQDRKRFGPRQYPRASLDECFDEIVRDEWRGLVEENTPVKGL
jgi:hypothetical protein